MIIRELVFIRHGQAQCNVDGVVGGPAACTGLTEFGHRQAGRAARCLADEQALRPFTALYAGPRLRLQQTGQILARALGLRLVVEPLLDGPLHGEADGRPWREIKDAFGGGPHTRPDSPWATGSDTWRGYLQRAGQDMHELLNRHQEGRILIVAHGETVIAAHTLLLRLAPESAGFTVDHASFTRWQQHRNRRGQQRWLLHSHNDTAHLAELSDRP
ncbi:histidine phosphatase family protein [Kitasatospora sp. LaBMicrA B282]|uniref:histidine phosphatase family protein n=1 Tax=Kitasatospora sp. LaBMicrA B282 TaxID=3420949 RepID=UPI003D14FAB1